MKTFLFACLCVLSLHSFATDPINPSEDSELRRKGIIASPNPCRDRIHISIGEAESARVQVYNIVGKLMAEEYVKNTNASFDLSSYPSGIYIYAVTTEGKKISTGKLVKQ